MPKPIYLDYNATTPVVDEVLNEMLPYFKEHFGNPSSQGHSFGWKADLGVQKSKKQVAEVLGCTLKEIYFTSGATESNNWALLGLVSQLKKNSPSQPIHLLTSPVEHKSILGLLEPLKHQGVEIDLVPVNAHGIVEIETLKKFIRPETKIMSFMWVNNELGVINPILEIGQIAHEQKIYFHTDATQAVGKIKIDLKNTPIDLLTFSGHKIYGPKGVGALYVRGSSPHIEIEPLIWGGGQQGGQRAGTLNVTGIVGLGAACAWMEQNRESEQKRMAEFNYQLRQSLAHFPQIQINNPSEVSVPQTLSLTFKTISQDKLALRLSHLAMSATSACGSGSFETSHVLKSIGLSGDLARQTLRLSMGHFLQNEDLVKITDSLTSLYT